MLDDLEQEQIKWVNEHMTPNIDQHDVHPKTSTTQKKSLKTKKQSFSLQTFVDDELDLHNHHIDEALFQVKNFLEISLKSHFKTIRIIHGFSNTSIQSIRHQVLRELQKHKHLIDKTYF